jgi:hypothetical protein
MDHGPLNGGTPPFDLLVTSLEFGEVTPASRSVDLGTRLQLPILAPVAV